MKYILFMLVAGFMTLCMAEIEDNHMKIRALTLMSELNVRPASEYQMSDLNPEALSAKNFITTGNLIVSHKPEDEDNGGISSDKLLFLDEKGEIKAFGIVKIAKSSKYAQVAFFEGLAMNSLPMRLLLKRYEINVDGPGDICIASKTYDKVTEQFVIDESQIHFIRGNIIVSVQSKDEGLKAKELAKMMDEMLLE